MTVFPKSYELAFDERPKYLYVHVKTDTFSPEIAMEYLREVIAECRELQYTRLLIVREIPVMLSPSQNRRIASQLANMAVEGMRIAIVDPRPEVSELNKFSRAASLGFGIKLRAYSDLPTARRWLLYE